MRTVAIVALITFVIDQLSKWVVVHLMGLDTRLAIDVLPPFLNFRMAWNYGINFGILAGDDPLTRWVLIAVALVISGAVLWWVHNEPLERWHRFAAGLLVGGALGNVIDRLIYGAVADFLNMSCCGISNPYAFNVADIAVFAGAFGMVLLPSGKKPS